MNTTCQLGARASTRFDVRSDILIWCGGGCSTLMRDSDMAPWLVQYTDVLSDIVRWWVQYTDVPSDIVRWWVQYTDVLSDIVRWWVQYTDARRGDAVAKGAKPRSARMMDNRVHAWQLARAESNVQRREQLASLP
jgi:hypothetical protein